MKSNKKVDPQWSLEWLLGTYKVSTMPQTVRTSLSMIDNRPDMVETWQTWGLFLIANYHLVGVLNDFFPPYLG